MSDSSSYVVVTPVRNEGRHIGRTIASMVGQTVRPLRWVIVDDGSSDGTAEIVGAATGQHDWITMVRRRDRGRREPGGGVVEAFYDGYPRVAELPWSFLVKLDGDLSFDPNYFERCLGRFAADERLGIAGGTVNVWEAGSLKVDAADAPPFHVRGATKIYRRECWADVSPLLRAPGWDTIDEVKANMKGWTTRTFGDLQVVQHKPTGGADGTWHTWFKNGRACYMSGYDPFFMLAKCVKRSFDWPPLVPGLALCAGFCSAYFRGVPYLTESDVVRYLRTQQRRRLLLRGSIYG